MKLIRYAGNPILNPVGHSTWENFCVCNPAAWYDGTKVSLLYRAAADTEEHRIYFGLADSEDGLEFRRVSDQPVFGPSENGWDAGCVEDPRIIACENYYLVTYAARMFPPGPYWKGDSVLMERIEPIPTEFSPAAVRENITRSGLAATRDFRRWRRLGPITSPRLDDRDVILFPERIRGRFIRLHRPASWFGNGFSCSRPSIWISSSEDILEWKTSWLLMEPAFDWESNKIGGSAPPLRTPQGWLTLYHGVDENKVYRTGAMLLDLQNPRRILARLPEPILEPETDYERSGVMKNVVFPCGNVMIGDRLFVYYGGADTCCCVATCQVEDLIKELLAHPWKD